MEDFQKGDIIGMAELDAMPENGAIVLFESKMYLDAKGFQRDYDNASEKVRAFYDANAHLEEGAYFREASKAARADSDLMVSAQ